jgi:hypothetical protein
MRLKRRDPLHVLLDYIATVSAASAMFSSHDDVNLYAQRAPGCHMALVHDDDLVPILGVGDVTVSER